MTAEVTEPLEMKKPKPLHQASTTGMGKGDLTSGNAAQSPIVVEVEGDSGMRALAGLSSHCEGDGF